MATNDPLAHFRAKRDFARTLEPDAGLLRSDAGQALRLFSQKHAARNPQYDFRQELGGTLKSWPLHPLNRAERGQPPGRGRPALVRLCSVAQKPESGHEANGLSAGSLISAAKADPQASLAL